MDSCAANGTIPVLSLDEIPSAIEGMGLRPVQVSPAFSGLSVYAYLRPDGRRYFMLNESPDLSFEGEIRLPASLPLVYYDGFTDRCEELQFVMEDGAAVLQIRLEPGESCLLKEHSDASLLPRHRWAGELAAACDHRLALPDGWHICCIDTQGRTVPEESAAKDCLNTPLEGSVPEDCPNTPSVSASDSSSLLVPISDRLPAFSGTVIYERELVLDQIPETVLFRAEHVYDVMRLFVNGREAGCCLTPPWQIEISTLLKNGTNKLRVEVATTPVRDQFNYPSPPFDFQIDPIEPTGMFGGVELLMKGNEK